MPYFSDPQTSRVSVQQEATGSYSLFWDLISTAPTGVLTLFNHYLLDRQSGAVSAYQRNSGEWASLTANDPDKLFTMRAAYRRVTGVASDEDQEILAELLKIEIDVQNLDLSRTSVATVLRHALDAAPLAGIEDYAGMPILFTNAMLLDYLIEDHGLLITTRMKALTSKETRVYSIKHLPNLPPDELAKTIRHAIRPWSWRSQINDLGDQLKGSPLPTELLTLNQDTWVSPPAISLRMPAPPSLKGICTSLRPPARLARISVLTC